VRNGIPAIFPHSPEDDDGAASAEDDHLRLSPGLTSTTREVTIVPRAGAPAEGPARRPDEKTEDPKRPVREDEAMADQRDASDASTETNDKTEREATSSATSEPSRRSSRPKRSSIPSWDEIVFGTKSE
jgi:hypothetical protein